MRAVARHPLSAARVVRDPLGLSAQRGYPAASMNAFDSVASDLEAARHFAAALGASNFHFPSDQGAILVGLDRL